MRGLAIDVPAGKNLGWCVYDDSGIVESGCYDITAMGVGDAESILDFVSKKVADPNRIMDKNISTNDVEEIVMERPCGGFANIVGKLWRMAGIIETACVANSIYRFGYISPGTVDKVLGLKKIEGKTRKNRIESFLAQSGYTYETQHEADAMVIALAKIEEVGI